MGKSLPSTTLQKFFSGIAESTFQIRLGVADPPLIDYLSVLLIRFVRLDSVQRVRKATGAKVTQLSEMMAEASHRVGEARRDMHRQIGDYALFWAGLYPESLRRRKGLLCEGFHDYCSQGKRAYEIASTIESETEPPGEMLHRLSQEFELCAYGLREVRREIEQGDDDDRQSPYLITPI